MKNSGYKIVLASGSPRRKAIMEQIGLEIEIMVSHKDEVMRDTDPCELVRELSEMKASDVAKRVEGNSIIIGADTVVAFEGRILGKPADEEDAFKMLKRMQNNTHMVHTGVCIIIRREGQDKKLSFDVTTKVTLAPATDDQLHSYIATGEPMDKAGAYAIQGQFAPFVSSVEGEYYNIVGLPISAIFCRLLEEGIDLWSLRTA